MPKMTYATIRTWIRRVTEIAADTAGAITAIRFLIKMLGDDYEEEEEQIIRLCQDIEDEVAAVLSLVAEIEARVDREE